MAERLVDQVARGIVNYIREQAMPANHHLAAQQLADLFRVSRVPVTAALKDLETAGVVYSAPNRGYFVARAIGGGATPAAPDPDPSDEDNLYFLIAEDRLSGKLPVRVSENEMMRRYDVSRRQLQKLLVRITDEGWIDRLPGRGWEFRSTLTSGDAYTKAYQFRAAIEAQSMLQPDFQVDQAQLKSARLLQQELLDGGIFTLPRARLYEINTEFHETIVAWSNNGFFLDSLRRINRLRRLMEYRVGADRKRLRQECDEHLLILDMIEQGDNAGVSIFLHKHIARAWLSKTGEQKTAFLPA